MHFWPFDVTTVHITYACLGSFVVFFTLFSLLIREKLYLGEAIWATVFGIAIGPYGTNIVDPRSWGAGDAQQVNQITMEVTRVVLALGVFAIGVELPKSYILRHWRSLSILLIVGMTWGWLICGALIYVLVPGLQFYPSLVVSACLTPTDPILAAAVCGGKFAQKHVPLHLRRILAAESAANDGLAFPFLYISLYLVLESAGEAVRDWFLITWLYEVAVGILLGCFFGALFRFLMKVCEKRDFIDRSSSVAQYVALAVMTMGFALLLGVDELLAAFFAGTAFSWDGAFNEATEDTSFSSVIEMLFDSACFIFIGAWMPFASFYDATLTLSVWRLVVITILLLLVRRIPPILISYKIIPDIKNFKEALFSGHFGPMGVGAVFISSLAVSKLPPATAGRISSDDQQTLLAASIQPIVAFVVLWSILIHGLSIPFWTLSKRVNTLTNTWPRSPSLQPEWLNQVRR
ncbi:Sodium/hydrogen exchanger, partial [Calocera cornea HHB12733]